MNNPLLDLVASVASLNPAAGEIGAGTLANLQSAAQAILDTNLDPRLMPRPLPGRRFVGAFTLPCDATPLANLVGAFARAYPESTLGGTVHPWAFVSAPVENGKGGAAEPGGMGDRGEAPDFFSGRPGPAPDGAEKPFPAAKPTLGKVAMTVVPGTLDAFDGQRRRLTFELAEMPAGCELGQTWGIVLPDPVAGHAVPCQEAPFMGWTQDQAFDRRFESRGDRFDGLAYRHTSGEFRWTITQRPPLLDQARLEAREDAATAEDSLEERFAAWYADVAGIFGSRQHAREMFDRAQP